VFCIKIAKKNLYYIKKEDLRELLEYSEEFLGVLLSLGKV
jgi:Holliday junction resolvase